MDLFELESKEMIKTFYIKQAEVESCSNFSLPRLYLPYLSELFMAVGTTEEGTHQDKLSIHHLPLI